MRTDQLTVRIDPNLRQECDELEARARRLLTELEPLAQEVNRVLARVEEVNRAELDRLSLSDDEHDAFARVLYRLGGAAALHDLWAKVERVAGTVGYLE